DSSLSMGYTAGGVSRFDQAKTLAAELVKSSRPGDSLSLVLMGQPPRAIIPAPSKNLKEVEKEVADLAITHGSTDLTASFQKTDEVLGASDIVQKEVVFLTDLQAASWRPPAGAADGLKRVLARFMAREPHSILIDLGERGGENRAVTDLQLDVP